MIRFWTADPHFNHPNIIRYCNRPQLKAGDLKADGYWVSPEVAFERAEQMNAALARDANMRVKPDDTVVCVGDFSCRGGEKGVQGLHKKPADILAGLNGTWVIVGGNHDDNNGVKTTCDFMVCEIAKYRVGVQHRPLFDETAYKHGRMSDRERARLLDHAGYCRDHFDFIICGHVHNAWKVRKIAGIWHVNVGVDVCRYMPVNDVEVALLYEKAIREDRKPKSPEEALEREGARAYCNGITRAACPYPQDSKERASWQEGWDEKAFYGGWQ